MTLEVLVEQAALAHHRRSDDRRSFAPSSTALPALEERLLSVQDENVQAV